jgi:hypothetical protein
MGMDFVNDNLWIILVSVFALITYTKVWNLAKRVDALEKSSNSNKDVDVN